MIANIRHLIRAVGQYINVESLLHLEEDSPGNDFGNGGFSAPPALIEAINERTNPYEVVAFRTNGWIKSRVVYPLRPLPGTACFEGIYVRWGS